MIQNVLNKLYVVSLFVLSLLIPTIFCIGLLYYQVLETGIIRLIDLIILLFIGIMTGNYIFPLIQFYKDKYYIKF